MGGLAKASSCELFRACVVFGGGGLAVKLMFSKPNSISVIYIIIGHSVNMTNFSSFSNTTSARIPQRLVGSLSGGNSDQALPLAKRL
jgi:hypothetical protein